MIRPEARGCALAGVHLVAIRSDDEPAFRIRLIADQVIGLARIADPLGPGTVGRFEAVSGEVGPDLLVGGLEVGVGTGVDDLEDLAAEFGSPAVAVPWAERTGALDGVWRDVVLLERRSRVTGV